MKSQYLIVRNEIRERELKYLPHCSTEKAITIDFMRVPGWPSELDGSSRDSHLMDFECVTVSRVPRSIMAIDRARSFSIVSMY